MKTRLSKSKIMEHRQCPKRLWLTIKKPDLAEVSASTKKRFAVGHEVGKIAQGLFPKGRLIRTLDPKKALDQTQKALNQDKLPIFEAAFLSDDVLIRADLLFPGRNGYRMVEVKSSTSVKDYHLEDGAIQHWVAEKAGLALKRVEIAHINNQFVYPGGENYEGLFTFENISKETRRLKKEVLSWIESAGTTLEGKKPNIEPGKQCKAPYECPYIKHCNSDPGEDVFPVEILPYKSGKTLAEELRSQGYEDLREVPGKKLSSLPHRRIWKVTKSGSPFIDPKAGAALKNLPYPRYYLDFETISFAVPIWPGTRPYQQIPFQWSCHVERKANTIQHASFLAGDNSDPRRLFAESLVKCLKTSGPILVYNQGFEAGRIRELADDLKDLAKPLDLIHKRLFDLLPIARKNYYHRDMRGSWSLKAVLPTIAPELDYGDLEVADGEMAQEAYLKFIDPKATEELYRQLRENLLAYCERDTWGLVEMAHFFQNPNGYLIKL